MVLRVTRHIKQEMTREMTVSPVSLSVCFQTKVEATLSMTFSICGLVVYNLSNIYSQ